MEVWIRGGCRTSCSSGRSEESTASAVMLFELMLEFNLPQSPQPKHIPLQNTMLIIVPQSDAKS